MHRAIVHSCWGGCGNHLRWLLLLDPGFLLFDRGPISDKVDYILTNVYPKERNCRNWFDYEFKYRQVLNTQIKFAHTDFGPGWENRPGQFDSQLNYYVYPRNPEFTKLLYKKFLSVGQTYTAMVQHERSQAEKSLTIYTGAMIDTEDLYMPLLDSALHSLICKDFKIDFKSANEIHSAWYTAHNRIEGLKTRPGPLYCPYMLTSFT